jgi:hypothetical protein
LYNLAKSLATSATNYLSGIFTNDEGSEQNTTPEFIKDEIAHYFANTEWKLQQGVDAYMNGHYYAFVPPDDDLAVQLKLIGRLIHHRFITLTDNPVYLFAPVYLPIDKRVIRYTSDLELLDPRNMKASADRNNPFRDSYRYKWFDELITELDWDTPLRLPTTIQPICRIRVVGDWYNYPEFNLDMQFDEYGRIMPPTIRDVCAAVYPIITHNWVCQHKITEYTSWWQSGREPDTLEIHFTPGYHIDNARYANGCRN